MLEIKFKKVSYETMLKCDGEIICKHPLLYNSINLNGVDMSKPMMFNQFLQEIGEHFTSMNCKSILAHGEWYVIDDGVQCEFFDK